MTDTSTTTSSTNVPHHSAIVGILLTALGFIASPFVLHFLPEKWAALAQAIGAALAAFGITGQIKQNTEATRASTAAVVQAVTSAPVDLSGNAAIAAAQARAMPSRSPIQGGGL